MERNVEKEKKLEDGLHNGIIIDVVERETKQKYKYVDVVIELADKFHVRASYPDFVCKSSKFGEMLARFGAVIDEGTSIDINKVLEHKKCTFQTITEGKYFNVVPASVKPVE